MWNHFCKVWKIAPAPRQHLLDVLDNPDQLQQLCMDLAITIDAGLSFVTKTYSMEGDGDIVVDAYDTLQEVATAAALQNYPNTRAMASKYAGDEVQAEVLFQQARACVQPAITYFLMKFNHQESPLATVVRMFKAIRVFCPARARQLQPDLCQVDQLRLIPALDDDRTIQDLKDELPAFLVAAGNVEVCTDRLAWWKDQHHLSAWQKAATMVFCLVPSSAAAVERVLSLLQAAVPDRQSHHLEDHIEVMLQLQCNRGQKEYI